MFKVTNDSLMLHPMCSIGIETIINKWLATLLEGVNNKKFKVKFKK